MADNRQFDGAVRRIDLHCHSVASSKPAEAVLGAISCPECYSLPEDVYTQARRRGMDFVTITDHDTIDGVLKIAGRNDVLVGEELTCWFPEDGCKLHLLVYGIGPENHAALQAMAANVYDVAEYIETNRIAHSVAHPLYRQNEKLERWHLERLLLMFKGFEFLNGAHSALHPEALEPVLGRLTPQEIQKLSDRHSLKPRWPEPWIKSRTAGSDDHGLLNVGKTWTEFPAGTTTIDQILDCIRDGTTRPGGEAGSSAKLAHTFYSVAVRYYGQSLLGPDAKPNIATTLMQLLVGVKPAPTRRELAWMAVKHKTRKAVRRVRRAIAGMPPETANAAGLVKRLFLDSAKSRLGGQAELREALAKGLPPLGEHEAMFKYVTAINRDVTRGIADAIGKSVDDASFTGLFEALSAVLAQQFVLIPYYFTVFHQNKERHLLRRITGDPKPVEPGRLRVGLFTDTLDDTNGVARFLRDMGGWAAGKNLDLEIHTCTANPSADVPNRHNFEPLLSHALPYYPDLSVSLPPILEVMEHADRRQFDVIHVSTPGPMGLCGWMVAKMLRVPLVGTYHTDFPAYVEQFSKDHRMTRGTTRYMSWLYGQMESVFSRSKSYRFQLSDLGVNERRVKLLPPAIDTQKFSPAGRDPVAWASLGVNEPHRLLYVGRVSIEKNLPMLVEVFQRICRLRSDVALVVAGEGPYLQAMKDATRGLPAHFTGYRNDRQLVPLYCGASLFVFPSRTDTLGQVVMESLACGLPAVVCNEGGPKELIENDVTGLVLGGDDVRAWTEEIDRLLSDEPRRARMTQAALDRAKWFTLGTMFDEFWTGHVEAARAAAIEDDSFLRSTTSVRM